MSHLAIYADNAPETPIHETTDRAEIAATLKSHGARFEMIDLPNVATSAEDTDAVLAALGAEISAQKQAHGYQACDVVRLRPDNPQAAEFRAKFLDEHTHSEDECRLMVDGSGCFYLHLGDKVARLVVEGGDLISVPDGTKHWFDMGPKPSFTALRLFTNPDGWVGPPTGDDIADRFPKYEP